MLPRLLLASSTQFSVNSVGKGSQSALNSSGSQQPGQAVDVVSGLRAGAGGEDDRGSGHSRLPPPTTTNSKPGSLPLGSPLLTQQTFLPGQRGAKVVEMSDISTFSPDTKAPRRPDPSQLHATEPNGRDILFQPPTTTIDMTSRDPRGSMGGPNSPSSPRLTPQGGGGFPNPHKVTHPTFSRSPQFSRSSMLETPHVVGGGDLDPFQRPRSHSSRFGESARPHLHKTGGSLTSSPAQSRIMRSHDHTKEDGSKTEFLDDFIDG